MTGNQNYLHDEGFDLTDIFIGRDQQLDLFEMYFHRWKGLLARETAADNKTPVPVAPSPDNKIQGLVVLLYGHGGFGKSTLLRHYRDFVLKENDAQLAGFVHASSVIDWENVPESRRSLFTLSSDRFIDASVYYRMLCAQLAGAIGKEIDTFKRFQRAMRDNEEARRQANQIIESTRGDERYASLRGLASEGIVALLHLIPPVGSLLNNQQIAEAVKGFAGAGVSIASDEVTRLHTKMREKLGARLDDYLEPDVKLGQSIGLDLREFARNYPLLLFFDTYEVVDEGDRLLRIVMGAAGPRVGWVIAGRDNLWTGLDQRLRSRGIEYGYKELVLPDRAKEFDFNVGGIGTFTPSDLKEYVKKHNIKMIDAKFVDFLGQWKHLTYPIERLEDVPRLEAGQEHESAPLRPGTEGGRRSPADVVHRHGVDVDPAVGHPGALGDEREEVARAAVADQVAIRPRHIIPISASAIPWITAVRPRLPSASVYSDHPTSPSSVVTFRNEKVRHPASQCRSSIRTIFIKRLPGRRIG